MTCDPAVLEASYAQCRRISCLSGSNFCGSFLLLGRSKRRAMDALYAFMRHTDDLADSAIPVDERVAALGCWRAEVTAALTGEFDRHPARSLLHALADTVQRYRIPQEHLLAVLDGVQMDLENRRYETFEELTGYCRRVASAVGIACVYVWGFQGDEALETAARCGLAFQLTNILRDLKEDAQQGRFYLPLDELRQCDYSPEDLAAGIADARFMRLMRFQVDRAERFYRDGVRLFDLLHPDGRRTFGMMTTIYHELLRKIGRDPAIVLSRRISLGRFEKTRIAARWLLLPPRRPVLS